VTTQLKTNHTVWTSLYSKGTQLLRAPP